MELLPNFHSRLIWGHGPSLKPIFSLKGCPRNICVLEMSWQPRDAESQPKPSIPDRTGRKQVEVHRHWDLLGEQDEAGVACPTQADGPVHQEMACLHHTDLARGHDLSAEPLVGKPCLYQLFKNILWTQNLLIGFWLEERHGTLITERRGPQPDIYFFRVLIFHYNHIFLS